MRRRPEVPRSRTRRTAKWLLAACTVTFGMVACGSKGPLETTPITFADASVDATADVQDAAPRDVVDAGPDRSNPVIACGQCVASECGKTIVTCLTDATCRNLLGCVTTQCLPQGADIGCMLNCAGGDFAALVPVLSIVQCVTTKCGEDCLPLLSNVPGGGGGGRGGDGGVPRRPRGGAP